MITRTTSDIRSLTRRATRWAQAAPKTWRTDRQPGSTDSRRVSAELGRLTSCEAHEWSEILGRYESHQAREVRRIVEPKIMAAFGAPDDRTRTGLR
jgi:hypothetical protein